jgi:hypothetical protein
MWYFLALLDAWMTGKIDEFFDYSVDTETTSD